MRALLVSLVLLVSLLGCEQKTASDAAKSGGDQATPGMTEEQKTLYALGLSVGHSLSEFQLSPEELAIVQSGMADKITGTTPKVEIEVYGPKIQGLLDARAAAGAAEEQKAGEAFLAEGAALPGAQKLPSGLVYVETAAGGGASPVASDVVKVHYRGTLRDGTEFDSSYKRNEPATFPLGGVIPCWTEGVQKMKVGGKARLVCPAGIAYGDRGAGADIPPGSTLDFEVELLEIVK